VTLWGWDRVADRRCHRCANDDVGEDIWIFDGDTLTCRRCAAATLLGEHVGLAATATYRARGGRAVRPLIAYKERRDDWESLEAPLVDALHESLAALIESHTLPEGTLVAPVPSYRGGRPHARTLTALAAQSIPSLTPRLDLLRKLRDIHQTGMGRRARHEQSQGAYGVRWGARVRGRAVIIADDVVTTGATLNACANALTAAGATAVYGATILRAVSPPPVRPVTMGSGQMAVRFTEPDRHGLIPCKGDGMVWLRFGCGPMCPYVLTAGPLRTPTPHIDVNTSWLCTCGARHDIHLARLGATLRVTVPPRLPAELLVAVQFPHP